MHGSDSEHLETYSDRDALPWLRDIHAPWDDDTRRRDRHMVDRIFAWSTFADQFDDINTVIELMLTEARDALSADAGVFYAASGEQGKLRMTYFQNGSTSDRKHVSDSHFIDRVRAIDDRSTFGYAAMTKRTLNIPSVEHIPSGSPYAYDTSFDREQGYNTISLLTVPIVGTGGAVSAVFSVMNKLSPLGVPTSFDQDDERYAHMLALATVPHLTKSTMTMRMIEAMLRMSEMRDPLETGAHVQRVGALAAEIYESWAEMRHIDRLMVMREKDALRLAAMLHDIGKVSIPDAILKKPSKLDPDEYEAMKTHCARGARMYVGAESRIEQMAYEITLHHHQRWDGRGYTGDPSAPPLAGDAIPIYARITSAADVLDALASPRVYKPAWSFDNVIEELEKNAGSQFDPGIVAAAVRIKDKLKEIIDMYR